MPRLSVAQWLIFVGLAAALAVTNVYTTLLTGWSEGGSIISVVVAVLVLRALGRTTPIAAINLGQTMASAGGAVGAAAAAYAAVRMADPSFTISLPMLVAAFLAMTIVGTMVGVALRRTIVRYHFPSGTACAVIQKSVTGDAPDSGRSFRLLTISSALAALATIPTKISLSAEGAALLSRLPLGSLRSQPIGVSLDPVLFGIGLVVGPRIAGGLLLGSLVSALLLPGWLLSGGVSEDALGDWVLWIAIAVLAVPTFVSVAFARVFREPPSVPPGFTPDRTSYSSRPSDRSSLVIVAAIAFVATVALIAMAFDVAWTWVLLATVVSVPMCLINGRIAADTDINPLLLVVIVLMTGFALVGGMSAVMLLGLGIIGSTVVGFAVDTMQDYRTGYLLDENPHHQTAVQLVGGVVGVLIAVPLLLLLDAKLGFGPEQGLPAPGPQIYTGIASALTGGSGLPSGLLIVVAVVSVGASVVSFFTVWPPTARYVPSLFGIGMGLLLPTEMTAAIFIGGAIKWGVSMALRGAAEAREASASRNVVLVGSAIFAAAALVTVAILGLTLVLDALGYHGLHFAG